MSIVNKCSERISFIFDQIQIATRYGVLPYIYVDLNHPKMVELSKDIMAKCAGSVHRAQRAIVSRVSTSEYSVVSVDMLVRMVAFNLSATATGRLEVVGDELIIPLVIGGNRNTVRVHIDAIMRISFINPASRIPITNITLGSFIDNDTEQSDKPKEKENKPKLSIVK